MGTFVQMLKIERATGSQYTSEVLKDVCHLLAGNLTYLQCGGYKPQATLKAMQLQRIVRLGKSVSSYLLH